MRDALVRKGVDRLDTALALLDAEGTVVYTSGPWERLDVPGTVPGAATVGEPYLPACEEVVDDSGVERVREAFAALLAGKRESAEVGYSLPRATALPRRFRLRGRRVTDDEGAHVVVEHAERTDEFWTEHERDHYRDTLADLATVVSHDIRSPLTAALSWAELLGADPETDTDKLDRIVSGVERTNAIADTAVTLARRTDVETVEPVEVGQAAARVWDHIDSGGADLAVEAVEPVLADERTVEVLLEHLLRNAVQHGTRDEETGPSELTVSVGPVAGGFYVADDGAGIEEGVRDNLLEVGVTTSPAEANTGIGLAIVERAVEAHGWTVEVADTGPGGTRFEITGVRRPP
jgi:signal transduction histidine kinase